MATDDSTYETGETPEVGDVIECLPGEGAYLPGHEISEGKQYTVAEIHGGYVFFKDYYGWWPTRFALVERDGVRI
jgi:hypothetical protein